jgi:hypothetical protein
MNYHTAHELLLYLPKSKTTLDKIFVVNEYPCLFLGLSAEGFNFKPLGDAEAFVFINGQIKYFPLQRGDEWSINGIDVMIETVKWENDDFVVYYRKIYGNTLDGMNMDYFLKISKGYF